MKIIKILSILLLILLSSCKNYEVVVIEEEHVLHQHFCVDDNHFCITTIMEEETDTLKFYK
jgi:hypothetical protein